MYIPNSMLGFGPDWSEMAKNYSLVVPSLAPLEVALFGKMGLKPGKNVVWWCPSLTLRVLIARWEAQGRDFNGKNVVWRPPVKTCRTARRPSCRRLGNCREWASCIWRWLPTRHPV